MRRWPRIPGLSGQAGILPRPDPLAGPGRWGSSCMLDLTVAGTDDFSDGGLAGCVVDPRSIGTTTDGQTQV